ncbi:MAG: Sjogren's syndrome/scleroderma autoantigen 1 family protein [Candidatus Methanoperedens sp.]|nr:Sjogren's syndrome/scleroderma autoantigen 1 family protein [Candidatus Methanoperedens sp.]
MNDIDEKLKMQRITRLLEKGGTMLATSHGCGAPMFRFQGKVLCPVCDTGTGEEKKISVEPDASAMPPRARKESAPEIPSRIQGDSGQISVMTKKKIQEIAGSLENETDLHRTKEKLECIELGIRILKLVE